MTPARTPPHIVAKLETELGHVLGSPEVKEIYESRGFQIMNGSSASLRSLIKEEVDRYSDVVRRAGAKIE